MDRATPAVPSLEPSSTTMISKSRNVWARMLSTAAPIVDARLWAGTTTLTVGAWAVGAGAVGAGAGWLPGRSVMISDSRATNSGRP
jgi:hypothetical protein